MSQFNNYSGNNIPTQMLLQHLTALLIGILIPNLLMATLDVYS